MKKYIFGLVALFFIAALPVSAAEKPFIGSPITKKQLFTCELVTSKYSHKTYKKGDKTILKMSPKWAICSLEKTIVEPIVKPVSVAPVNQIELAAQAELAIEASNMLIYGNPLGPIIKGIQIDQTALKNQVDSIQQQVNQLQTLPPSIQTPVYNTVSTSTPVVGGVLGDMPTPNTVVATTTAPQVQTLRVDTKGVVLANGEPSVGFITITNNGYKPMNVNGLDLLVKGSSHFGNDDMLYIMPSSCMRTFPTCDSTYYKSLINEASLIHVALNKTLDVGRGETVQVVFQSVDNDVRPGMGFGVEIDNVDTDSDVKIDPLYLGYPKNTMGTLNFAL